jgi:hypothetical protein
MLKTPAKNARVQVSATPKNTVVKIKAVDAFRSALIFESLPTGTTTLQIAFS